MSRATCDPRELSTAELHRRCQRSRPWELGLGAIQVAASTAAGGAVLVAAGVCIPGLVQCISVGPAFAAGLAVWGALEAGRAWLPGAAYREELAFRDWRAGRSPWAGRRTLRRWAERALSRTPAPDWLLVLDGVALAPEPAWRDWRWVKVELTLPVSSADPFRARAEGTALLRSSRDRGREARARALTAEEIEELLGALAELPDGLSPGPPAPPPMGAEVSGRCELLIARRAPFAAVQRSLVIPAREAGLPGTPEAALLRGLAEMAWPRDEAEDDRAWRAG
ncbi:hypothetical protein WMF31_15225 [Sorangium sp. So ce1036]|uniref:hypothetical protein n=1 Tax=Sorangium sp. So ce1036 TaxID=3133328 RepID=UPI003F005912